MSNLDDGLLIEPNHVWLFSNLPQSLSTSFNSNAFACGQPTCTIPFGSARHLLVSHWSLGGTNPAFSIVPGTSLYRWPYSNLTNRIGLFTGHVSFLVCFSFSLCCLYYRPPNLVSHSHFSPKRIIASEPKDRRTQIEREINLDPAMDL